MNILSVDLEEWFNFIGDDAVPPYDEWAKLPSRVEESTEQLMEILDGIRITFFVLGFVAERNPHLIKRIASFGHEIASHGCRHEFVFDLGPKYFRSDISRSKAILEDLVGKPCLGYRAPAFSIRQQDTWALEIIREEGFLYDSSVFPGFRSFGGIPGAFPYPHIIRAESGDLLEIPISTTRTCGLTTAFCGGGFFRIIPSFFIHKKIQLINCDNKPAVAYIHPRDIDAKQPRLKLKPLNRIMYYYGLKNSKEKFNKLVKSFVWGSCAELLYDVGLMSSLPRVLLQDVAKPSLG